MSDVRKAKCAVHGKLRSIECLVETGAGFVCTAEAQCRDSLEGSEEKLCKFWREGRCTKGSSCAFRHGDYGPAGMQPMGRQSAGRLGPGGEMDSWDGGGCVEQWGPVSWGADPWAADPYEAKGKGKGGKTPWGPGSGGLDHWEGKGKGFGPAPWGAADSWASDSWGVKGGMASVGMAAGDWMAAEGRGDRGGPAKETCCIHGKLRRVECLEADSDGNLVCTEGNECQGVVGEGGVKRAICKFFMQGLCERGAGCAFAHDESEIGQSLDEIPKGCGKAGKNGKGKGKGKDFYGEGGRHDFQGEEERVVCSVHGKKRGIGCMVSGPDGWSCKPGRECQNAGDGSTKRSMCRFFLEGACTRGEACAFAHNESEIGTTGAAEGEYGPRGGYNGEPRSSPYGGFR